jgi:choline dehydrogenase-like flavoprotein
VYADKEVVLCGGVINSPQLLMLSGIGDPEHLLSHGVSVRVALKGVGRNLHDHLVVDVRYRRRHPGALHRLLRMDRIGIDLLRTLLFGDGQSANVPATSTGLVRTQPEKALPDAQIALVAGRVDAAPYLAPFKAPYEDNFTIKGIMLQPESRGRILLASADPAAAPLIKQNFLATEGDRRTMRDLVRKMRAIGSQPPLRAFAIDEMAPGSDQSTDEDIDAFVRRTAVTLHHPVGTCKRGCSSDETAVLDEEFRVRGVDNLRVVDGSAMPQVVRGPVNAPIMMMAEVAADLLQNRRLPSQNGSVHSVSTLECT